MVGKGSTHIIPALVTPYGPSGAVSTESLRKLVRMNVDKGVTGFYAGGSSGEALLLRTEERERVYEIVRGEMPEGLALICHVGAATTAEAARLAKTAARLGADAVSAIPPIYYKYSTAEIVEYYRDIASAARLPVIVYNIPAFSGVDMKADFIGRLYEQPSIAGVKYTSYDLYDLERVRALDRGRHVFIGHDELFLPALSLGVDGLIGSTLNFMAEKFVAIAKHVSAGHPGEALSVQGEVNRIVGLLLAHGIFPSIKYALELLGIPCGECRKPFLPLSDSSRAAIREGVVARL